MNIISGLSGNSLLLLASVALPDGVYRQVAAALAASLRLYPEPNLGCFLQLTDTCSNYKFLKGSQNGLLVFCW